MQEIAVCVHPRHETIKQFEQPWCPNVAVERVMVLRAALILLAIMASRPGLLMAQSPGDTDARTASSGDPRARFPVVIRDARIGLPPGRFVSSRDDKGRAANVAKDNVWAPIYLSLEIAREAKSDAAVLVESSDSDKLGNRLVFPLQNLSGEQPGTRLEAVDLRAIPYVRTAGNELRISIRAPHPSRSPEDWESLSETLVLRSVPTRDVSRYVVLSLGSQLPGFTLPKEQDADDAGTTGSSKALRNGRLETAAITKVAEMPDQWFGYEAADIVILTTGTDDSFIAQLFTDAAYKPRLDALLEWVRRGGKLVVSVGRNANLVAQHRVLQEILPMNLNTDDPIRQETRLPISWSFAKSRRTLGALTAKGGAAFAVANLIPKKDRVARTLVPTTADKPSVVQAQYGLGRITLIAIDLERSPFLDYSDRAEFWDLLLREAGNAKASVANTNNFRSYGYGSSGDVEDEAAAGLRASLDAFEGVPVISFGWVAVFILLYTLLIGPIEYYFLKKVLKRLELTWITFPIIVLTVSAIAYFTAYALKGNDLKLNKVDVIDIDPASGRVYGRMWLTVFSPRIDRYTVGMEPSPGWTDPGSVPPQAGGFVDWFGGNSGGRESFVRRSYDYRLTPQGGASRDPFGDGVRDVYIPIWSTKSFSADWSAMIPKDTPPVASTLRHLDDKGDTITGNLSLTLPIPDLKSAVIIYAGKAYKQVNPIPTDGTPYNVLLESSEADAQWLSSIMATSAVTPGSKNAPRPPATITSSNNVAGILFHEESLAGNDAAPAQNSTLRRLDQSWRVNPRHRSELIVLARLPVTQGPVEDVLTAAKTVSPTRLWLGALPGSGTPRSTIPGTLQQDTWIRIFIPIQSVKP
jgi:hypothetical protein